MFHLPISFPFATHKSRSQISRISWENGISPFPIQDFSIMTAQVFIPDVHAFPNLEFFAISPSSILYFTGGFVRSRRLTLSMGYS